MESMMTVRGILALGLITASAQAQATMEPTNGAPNPYKLIDTWAKMPEGRAWGSVSAVDIDKDGVSVWVAERCGTNSCATSTLDPVLKFDSTGKVVAHFGSGLIISPHGIAVDRDGNVWVVDCACTGGGGGRGRGAGRGADSASAGRAAAPPAAAPPQGPPKGHQVYKFSPDGKLLMTLGKAGGGRDTAYFYQPNDVLIAPNGEIFVSEGHSSAAGSTARILKFSKEGKLIKAWGTLGNGPDDFDQPHALAMDSRGRLFVGDRGNNRIKILDQDGKLLDTWYQFSRPSGVYIDAKDNIYVADSESGSVGNGRTRTWKRGIRIGSAKDGSIRAFIPDPVENATNTSAAEGVAADSRGIIYGAEVGPTTYGPDTPHSLKRYVRP